MELFRIEHNIDMLTKCGEHKSRRVFKTAEAANRVFDLCSEKVNYYRNEYIILEKITVVDIEGEYVIKETETLRYNSETLKIGL